MVKRKITKKTKKQGKSKSINIINKIHIDQSKRTTAKGSNPKKSNIKTLPAFSSAPSSGGNYTRQIIQDPYYSQSQYENANMLRQYNNMIRQNNPQIGYGFQDKNRNDNLLLQDSPKTQLLDGNESVIESVVDNALYDDPKTNGDSQNAINQFQNSPAQMLPRVQEEDDEEKESEPKRFVIPKRTDEDDEQLLIGNEITDPIQKLMSSNKQYDDNGFKIFRDSDINANQYFNKITGQWTKANSAKLAQMREEGKMQSTYTKDPYEINMMFRDATTDLYRQGHGWKRYIEPDKKVKPVTKKVKEKVEEVREEDIENEFTVKIKPVRKKGSSVQISKQARIHFEGDEKEDDDVDASPSKIEYLFGRFKKN